MYFRLPVPVAVRKYWHRGEWCEACFNELYDVRHVTDLDGLALREVYVIGHYDKGLKSILGDIKFHGKKERVKWATPFLYSFMVDPVHKLSFKPDYVVPIPVSAKKRVIRGYNQVDLLFKNWASWLGWYWLDCLEKIDSTQAMFSLGVWNVRPIWSMRLRRWNLLLSPVS